MQEKIFPSTIRRPGRLTRRRLRSPFRNLRGVKGRLSRRRRTWDSAYPLRGYSGPARQRGGQVKMQTTEGFFLEEMCLRGARDTEGNGYAVYKQMGKGAGDHTYTRLFISKRRLKWIVGIFSFKNIRIRIDWLLIGTGV